MVHVLLPNECMGPVHFSKRCISFSFKYICISYTKGVHPPVTRAYEV